MNGVGHDETQFQGVPAVPVLAKHLIVTSREATLQL